MANAASEDVITGLTPLEERLVGVHPRLCFTSESVAELKEKINADPWKRMVARIARLADEGAMPHQPAMYLLTGQEKYMVASREAMLAIINDPNWPMDVRRQGFAGRDKLYNLALAYDWLYHDLDDETRLLARQCLDHNGRKHFEALALHHLYQSGIYTCNTLSDCLANVAAAGMAIYGDVADVGPWIRFVFEKVRLMTEALAGDGASQEGICYGGFFTEYYIKTVELVRQLLGWDFFEGNGYLRNVPLFYIYSMLPRNHITPRSAHLCFGDGVRYNWHGPDYFLRKLAAVYRDPHAQWAADVQEETGATRHAGAFLNLLWHDPSVQAQAPAVLPTCRHFTDKDIVFMRSGWDGDEAVFGFKCGPHSGHRALANYQHCIGAGHMAPDAGSFLLFAHGDWLISDGWYARKFTSARNTVLVDGVGQTGEPEGAGDWFECTELRREKRAPSILRAESQEAYDYVIGNVAPAYGKEAGLRRFLRHVLYVRPSCWVIVDELATKRPATFDLFFHAFGEYFMAERPFEPAADNVWTTGGERGKLRITALLPQDVEGVPEVQTILGIGAHHDREMNILRLHNGAATDDALFVTILEAYPASASPQITPSIETTDEGASLVLRAESGTRRFALTPGQAEPATPILRASEAT